MKMEDANGSVGIGFSPFNASFRMSLWQPALRLHGSMRSKPPRNDCTMVTDAAQRHSRSPVTRIKSFPESLLFSFYQPACREQQSANAVNENVQVINTGAGLRKSNGLGFQAIAGSAAFAKTMSNDAQIREWLLKVQEPYGKHGYTALDVGKVLEQAKLTLAKIGLWTKFLKSDALPFSKRKAEMLLRVFTELGTI